MKRLFNKRIGMKRIALKGIALKRVGKRLSLFVVLLYVGFGALDLLSWRSDDRQRSLLDRAFEDVLHVVKERSYTRPWSNLSVIGPGRDEDAAIGFHLLGTDINGNDVLLQMLKGARTALLLSLGVIGVSFPVGIALGLIAGYFGGRVDEGIQWLYTTVASIPWLLFVVTFLMVFGRGLGWIIVAIGLTSWVELARLIRGETLRLREYAFVRSARATGFPVRTILFREILPNTLPIIRINFALACSSVVLSESVLTFIGIGIEPGTSSWGGMISEAQREFMRDPVVWWNFGAATLLGIFPLVLALNFLAEEERR